MVTPAFSSSLYVFIITALVYRCGAAAVNRTDEASEATITDGKMECTEYDYPPVSSQLSKFPTLFETAKILESDSVARDLWNSISSSIPDIALKSTSFSGYSADDPDCWWTYNQCTQPKLEGLQADVTAPPEPSTLGYGFDDGPACDHNVFYDFLASNNQKATMFFIGSNVMSYPLEAQRALVDGHEICLHTWSHPHMTSLSSEDAFAEIYYSMQAVKVAVGVTPTCWRPPFGDIDDRIRAISKALGMQTFMWGYDTQDADVGDGSAVTPADVEKNYEAFIEQAKNGTFENTGAIVLTHELDNFTMSEAVKHYPQLKQIFKYIVPVGVGLNITQPYVESNYSLPTFEQYISGMVTGAAVNATTTSTSVQASSDSPSPSTTSTSSNESNAANVILPRTPIYFAVLISAVIHILV